MAVVTGLVVHPGDLEPIDEARELQAARTFFQVSNQNLAVKFEPRFVGVPSIEVDAPGAAATELPWARTRLLIQQSVAQKARGASSDRLQ